MLKSFLTRKSQFVKNLCAVVTLLLVVTICRADQLAWNSQEISNRAIAAIKPNSLMVSYCSQCDNQAVEVWWVKKAVVTPTTDKDLYEIEVFGKRLYKSKQTFAAGGFREPVTYKSKLAGGKEGKWFLQPVDLAYIYTPAADGTFKVLGKQLGLPCDVKTETIALPPRLLKTIAATYPTAN